MTDLPDSGRTVVKSRTAEHAVRPHLILVVSWKAGIYRKNFTGPSSGFYLLDTPCEARRPGWPLDSLSVELNGCPFLSPERRTQVQQSRHYKERLRAFLQNALGIMG